MQTIAEYLSSYATTLKYDDIPADVVHQAKRFIVDTLGCMFGGYNSEPAEIARKLAATVTSSRPATILCSMKETSMELAAFANDVATRYLDFNDGYMSKGSGHPSDSIAALLAAAEVGHASGRELLAATVLTYEVYCRISDQTDYKPLGIDHVTVGAIASVVGAARLLGLTPQQIFEAINTTVAANITLMQTRIGSISNWKACAYANANRNALFAAQLAELGITGPPEIFEGRSGFFKVVSREPFKLAPFGNDDPPFRIMRSHLKRFPLGNYSQTVVTAILEARPQISNVRDIVEVHVRTSEMALEIMADTPEKWRPRNRETADHSIPYTAGVALMFGTIDPTYFGEEYFLHNQELLDLVSKIKCSVSEEATQRGTGLNLVDLEITMRSGERRSIRTEYHRGHWRNPMSDGEVEEKFRSLVGNTLPADRVGALLEQLWKLDDLPDIRALIAMTAVETK